ncbi:large subunit ribosomal protein L7/L12 [Paenibacillus algorifonticola]|uniref:Large subunit ribosomal protein L7/L12 n=1 Tax=Paenibacillus algorifonticola TaxID=684063 RepID=A0A1I2FSG9_9BACL|nr:ribosomal protein L7/L12 [Paenibacillus algorifonticola]SFF07748.1 large subunit ribosomal protein L7/L12 [Paenibacillus algorifonticola]
METVEIIAVSALILSLLLLLKVFSLQRQLNEIKSELQWTISREGMAGLPRPNLTTPPSSPGMPHVSSSANIDERLLMLIAAGKRIQAIKEYREVSDVGLKEAKDYVDDLERRQY